MKIAFVNLSDGEGALDWATVGINSVPGALVCTGEDTVDNYNINHIESRVDQLIEQEHDLIVVSLNDVRKVYSLVCEHKLKESTGARLVVFVDGVAGRLEEINYLQRGNYLEILKAADFLLVNSETGRAFLESVVEDPEKIINIGLPVNIELIEQSSWENIQEKDRIWLGYIYYRPSSNLFACMFTLKKLGLRGLLAPLGYGTTKDYFSGVLGELGLADTIQLVPDRAQNEALEYMCMCGASLSMAVRDSLGRLAAEGAVCGVPAIGTANYFQERLFPDLTIEPFSFAEIGGYIASALDDETHLMDARETVEQYSYQAWRERFLEVVMESDPETVRAHYSTESIYDPGDGEPLGEVPGGEQDPEADN